MPEIINFLDLKELFGEISIYIEIKIADEKQRMSIKGLKFSFRTIFKSQVDVTIQTWCSIMEARISEALALHM